MAYETLDTKEIFRGKVFTVRTDHIRSPAGADFEVDVVAHAGAVTLVPLAPDGRVLFVHQYRHPAGKEMLELPAGTLTEGEHPRHCAERECREEIGLRPGSILSLGQVYLAPGYSSELNHIFLVSDFTPAPLPQDEDESIKVVPLDAAHVLSILSRGALEDAKTLAGLYLALPHLGAEFVPK
jgi:ADP-ribose pyrophosphatase